MSGAVDGQTGVSVFSPGDGQVILIYAVLAAGQTLCVQGAPTDLSPHFISNSEGCQGKGRELSREGKMLDRAMDRRGNVVSLN